MDPNLLMQQPGFDLNQQQVTNNQQNTQNSQGQEQQK